MTRTGRVVIIGAGPGDPGLITARGLRLLGEAHVVVYDRSVERLLRFAAPHAERIAAGAPAERDTAQDAISMLLAEKAREGSLVARLKWGDPFVFDSGAKEAMFLYEQGSPFEVVPGVPAFAAAAAAFRMSLCGGCCAASFRAIAMRWLARLLAKSFSGLSGASPTRPPPWNEAAPLIRSGTATAPRMVHEPVMQ